MVTVSLSESSTISSKEPSSAPLTNTTSSPLLFISIIVLGRSLKRLSISLATNLLEDQPHTFAATHRALTKTISQSLKQHEYIAYALFIVYLRRKPEFLYI